MESWVQSWRPRTNAFAIFPLHLSKVLRLPRKIDARSYEVLHLSRKIISANLKTRCSKMQPLSGNQRPDLLTALMNMSLVLRLPQKMHLCRSSSNVPRLPSFWEMLQKPHVLLTFDKVHNPVRLPRETTSERPKVVRACWLGNVLRATTACTFSTSQLPKSAHEPVSFLHFWLRNVFAPQRRALFRHLNFQKCSEHVVFLRFWLRNVLRATTACTFSTSQLPKVLRTCGVFNMLTSKFASRHNGVQFFISHLASWLRTRRFKTLASLLFDPPSQKSLEKHSVSRLSYLFAHLDLLSSETFSFAFFFILLFLSSPLVSCPLLSSPLLSSPLFFSSLLWLSPSLLFICPYCRKFDF